MSSITGVKEIDKVLKELPRQMTHTILSAAHAAAAKPLIEREKLLAPEGPTGNLVDSIGVTKTSLKKANLLGQIRVGPRRNGGFKGFHGTFNEYGTKQRRTRKTGANRGSMKAKPFVKPAFAQTKGQVESGIAVNIGKVMLRTMRRYIKR